MGEKHYVNFRGVFFFKLFSSEGKRLNSETLRVYFWYNFFFLPQMILLFYYYYQMKKMVHPFSF